MRNVRALSCLLAAILVTASGAPALAVEWAGRMGGTASDAPASIAVDPGGSSYVTGLFRGPASFGVATLQSAGGDDIFVEKLDPQGVVLWATKMGGGANDGGYGIAVDSEGNCYVTGFFQGRATFESTTLTAFGNKDIFVMKLDHDGHLLWAKQMGGSGHESGHSIAVDAAGNSYVTGYFKGNATFGTIPLTSLGLENVFVQKLDPDGTVLWAKRMGGAAHSEAKGIALDPSGNSYVTGDFDGTATFGSTTLSSAGEEDIFVEKLDPDGLILWAKSMGGPGLDNGCSIAADPGGSSYVAGFFGGAATFGSIALASAGGSDIFVEKLDPSGHVLWASGMGGPTGDSGQGIAIDANGRILVAGYFGGPAAFGPTTLVSAGLSDVFVERLDPAGHVLWADRMGGASIYFESGEDVAVDPDGSIFVAGYFYGFGTFGPVSLASAGGHDIFVEKLLSGASGHFGDHSYGSLLFHPLHAASAEALPQDVFSSASLGMFNGLYDRFFLSSQRALFSPLVVDDAIHINGVDSGLGPYSLQPGVPPYLLGEPIERNLQPLPAYDVTSFLPPGQSTALFELLDLHRDIHGNTAVYLVRDCGIWLDETEAGQARLNWVSERVQVDAVPSHLEAVSGGLLDLRADRDFRRACLLGQYPNTTQVVDVRTGTPPPGDGFYYLVSGTCTSQIGYGNSLLGSPPVSVPRALLPRPVSCQ